MGSRRKRQRPCKRKAEGPRSGNGLGSLQGSTPQAVSPHEGPVVGMESGKGDRPDNNPVAKARSGCGQAADFRGRVRRCCWRQTERTPGTRDRGAPIAESSRLFRMRFQVVVTVGAGCKVVAEDRITGSSAGTRLPIVVCRELGSHSITEGPTGFWRGVGDRQVGCVRGQCDIRLPCLVFALTQLVC